VEGAPDPIPWDARSRFGRPGRLARSLVRRVARPLEVRQAAREQRVWQALEAHRARLDAVEARVASDISATGHQLGSAAASLGRRIDAVEYGAERAAALAQPTLDPLARRLVERYGAGDRAICSLATGPYVELLAIAAPSYEAYARRWGWDVILSVEELSAGRPAPWAKVALVRELLDAYDWVLWIDADACFVRLDADIAAEQEPGKDLYLVEHAWGEPPQQSTANTGVFMLRSGSWARDLLDAMWAREALIDHRWWENAALLELLGYNLDPAGMRKPTSRMERVKLIDLAWNSVRADPAPVPIVNHHGGGLPVRELRERLLDDSAELRRRLMTGPERPASDDDDRRAVLRATRSRDRLPDAFNALGLVGRGAEIGVRKGEFSELILSRWRGTQLLSIDPWTPADPESYRDSSNVSDDEHERFLAEAQGRLLAFGERSLIWRLTSEDAAARIEDSSLDFVYLDARHDDASVMHDLELWWPKVRPGGVLAGHDYLDGELPAGVFGVKSAVDRFFDALNFSVHATEADWPWPSWSVLRGG
jgi:hypothetical protein